MKKWRAVSLSGTFGRYSPEALDMLKEVAELTYMALTKASTENEIIRLIEDADAVVVGATGRISAKVLASAKRLKIVSRHGVGVDNVDVEAATERGIVVTYTPHANADSVVEHAFALIMCLLRRICGAERAVKSGRWAERQRFMGIELRGKTLGIIGLGDIGRRVARVARNAFAMRVMYHSRTRKIDVEKGLDIGYVDLETLLKESDFVTLHVPLTDKTYHMIGEDQLKIMKREAVIINTARGGIIDELALVKALKERRIAGAALDVMEAEPPDPKSPILDMDNVVITPHIAAYTEEAMRRMGQMISEDIVRLYRGLRPFRVANPEVLSMLKLGDSEIEDQ